MPLRVDEFQPSMAYFTCSFFNAQWHIWPADQLWMTYLRHINNSDWHICCPQLVDKYVDNHVNNFFSQLWLAYLINAECHIYLFYSTENDIFNLHVFLRKGSPCLIIQGITLKYAIERWKAILTFNRQWHIWNIVIYASQRVSIESTDFWPSTLSGILSTDDGIFNNLDVLSEMALSPDRTRARCVSTFSGIFGPYYILLSFKYKNTRARKYAIQSW